MTILCSELVYHLWLHLLNNHLLRAQYVPGCVLGVTVTRQRRDGIALRRLWVQISVASPTSKFQVQ